MPFFGAFGAKLKRPGALTSGGFEMRLFTAVNFDDSFKLRLARHMEELRKNALRGNFSRVSNLHITLAFIGETERLREAEEALTAVEFEPFEISLGRVGLFKRRGGDICWIGVRDDKEIKALAASVARELISRGFELEDREFKAHLTLAREVTFKSGFEPAKYALPEDLSYRVEKISLMKSERIKGVLTYTELAAKFCT